MLDLQGNDIQTLKVGQQAVLKVVLQNNRDSVQPFVVLVELRDGAGITQYLAWQSGKLKDNYYYSIEASWMPVSGCYEDAIDWSCTYEIRSFVVSNLTTPQVLNIGSTTGGITVTDELEQGNKSYNLEIDGKEYDIEYSLDGGRITSISHDFDSASLTFFVENKRDTMLTIWMPNDIAVERMFCHRDVFPETTVEAFVDTIPAQIQSSEGKETTIWQIQLPAGTEEVEIVGACFA